MEEKRQGGLVEQQIEAARQAAHILLESTAAMGRMRALQLRAEGAGEAEIVAWEETVQDRIDKLAGRMLVEGLLR